MKKVVLFGKNYFQYTDYDIVKLLFSDVVDDNDFFYIPPDISLAEKYVCFWEKKKGFRKWTSCFGIPFKKYLYKSILNCKNDLFENDSIIFVFMSMEHWYKGDDGFIKFLRESYKKCKIVYYILNSVYYIDEDVDELKTLFDSVLSFDREESEKYCLSFFQLPFSSLSIPKNDFPASDCFFVGNAKKRLDEIVNVYKALSSAGLKCIFFITNVPIEKQEKLEGVYYNSVLHYDDVLKYVNNTKVVLEVVQSHQKSSTLRLSECIRLNKKLLTNNAEIICSDFYDDKHVQVFKNPFDIDYSFFFTEVTSEYPNKKKLNPRLFLDNLKKQI